jgi:hypothetical protein
MIVGGRRARAAASFATPVVKVDGAEELWSLMSLMPPGVH